MTLADLQLAALRVVVGAVPLAIAAAVLGGGPGTTGRAIAAAAAFALWGLGPPALAERAAARRGLGPLGVGLAAGAAAAVGVPGGPGPRPRDRQGARAGGGLGRAGRPRLCVVLGVWGGLPVAGVTFVHVSPMVRGRSATPVERWLFEPLLALSALFAGVPLLAVYAVADGLELLLVGPAPAMVRGLEARPETAPTSDR